MDDDQPSAILGTSSGVKTMADNTLRISFDIEPRYAQQAFAMFGIRGSPAAIARIVPEVAQAQARKQTVDDHKPVGGVLAKLAGTFCGDEDFRRWLRLTYDPLPRTADDAAQIVRQVCRVDSRAYLDHIKEAADIFHEKFRLPYSEWLQNGMQ